MRHSFLLLPTATALWVLSFYFLFIISPCRGKVKGMRAESMVKALILCYCSAVGASKKKISLIHFEKIEEVTHAMGKGINEDAAVHRAKGTAGETSSTMISISVLFEFVKRND